ncbi:MAG: SRPBCC family protein [Chloroflexota bacterium]
MKKFGKMVLWVVVGLIVVIGALSVVSPTSAKIHLEEEVNAPADEVWAVLAHRFAEIGDWAPNIEWSRAITQDQIPDGFVVAPSAPVPGRVTPNPLGDVSEVLTVYSEEERAFTFDADGLPAIVTHTTNSTRVTELDDGRSLVTFDVDMGLVRPFNVLAPLIEGRIQTSKAGPGGMIKDLKVYVESGQTSQ